jgi:hypothetical protein
MYMDFVSKNGFYNHVSGLCYSSNKAVINFQLV